MATLDQITKLENAIASGTLRVETNGRSITYRDLNEMKQILFNLKREYNKDNTIISPVYVSYGSGL